MRWTLIGMGNYHILTDLAFLLVAALVTMSLGVRAFNNRN
jgi:hypothetical protein